MFDVNLTHKERKYEQTKLNFFLRETIAVVSVNDSQDDVFFNLVVQFIFIDIKEAVTEVI